MDILSSVASVIAVIQISGVVIDICYQYRTGVKNAPKSIIRLMNEVRGIRTVLEELETALEEGRSSEVARPASLEEVTKSDGLLSLLRGTGKLEESAGAKAGLASYWTGHEMAADRKGYRKDSAAPAQTEFFICPCSCW